MTGVVLLTVALACASVDSGLGGLGRPTRSLPACAAPCSTIGTTKPAQFIGGVGPSPEIVAGTASDALSRPHPLAGLQPQVSEDEAQCGVCGTERCGNDKGDSNTHASRNSLLEPVEVDSPRAHASRALCLPSNPEHRPLTGTEEKIAPLET